MSAFTKAVAHHLRGVHFFSTGAMLGCDECGLAPSMCRECCGIPNTDVGECPVCEDRGVVEKDEHDRELADEPQYGTSSCDSCGTSVAGNRHYAHGKIAESEDEAHEKPTTHFSICEDCLLFHANGQEPKGWTN